MDLTSALKNLTNTPIARSSASLKPTAKSGGSKQGQGLEALLGLIMSALKPQGFSAGPADGGGVQASYSTRQPGNPGTTVGAYGGGGVASVGGNTPIFGNQVGGSVGMDNGRPFGNANVNGKIIGQFGPQGQ